MDRIHVIVAALLLQTVFTVGINGNVIRRRRQLTSASLYGNQNQAGGVQAGYNYPANNNLYGTSLNNQGTKDLYGNPIVPANSGNTMNNIGLNNQQLQQEQLQRQQQQQQLQQEQLQRQQQQSQQPQQPQQQLYGVNNQAAAANPSYAGTNFYSGSGTNHLLRDPNANMNMRDANGNLLPAGSAGSSLYSSSNSQLGYPGNTNQAVVNKDLYNPSANAINNNNQYGPNVNPYPHSNTYNGQMTANNNNAWSNNQYNTNAGDTWMPNRELSNTNTNNNNNNAYSNPSSPYFYNNDAHRLMTSCIALLSSFLAIWLLHF